MFLYTAYSRAVYQGMDNVVAMVVAQGINKVTVRIMSPAVAAVFAKAIPKAIDKRPVQSVFINFQIGTRERFTYWRN
ncbi:hypothetical protein [Rhodococcus sp. LB1]|uniref:hypothetical protein n=1 Tax=Rhodococcus sp. LB1 TaxID=1807499 RepID=UPI000A9859FC|nr:hypothetical protein [Rhodococcus sp. LB1]